MLRTVLAVAAITIGVSAVVAQSDPIAARKGLMKNVGAVTKTGGQMAKGEVPYDQAKAQEPAQASQSATGRRTRTGSGWVGQRTSLAGAGAFRPAGDRYDGVGQQPGDGTEWSHGDLPAEARPWWVQVDSFPARRTPTLAPREHRWAASPRPRCSGTAGGVRGWRG